MEDTAPDSVVTHTLWSWSATRGSSCLSSNPKKKKKKPATRPSPVDPDTGEALAEEFERLDLPLSFGSSRNRCPDPIDLLEEASFGSGESASRSDDDSLVAGGGDDWWSALVGPSLETSRGPPSVWLGSLDPDHGLPYYYSEETGDSRWELPLDGYVVPLVDLGALDCASGSSPLRRRLLPFTPKKTSKYWKKRYSLFSLFDSGVCLNTAAWYSVTPEGLARHHARKLTALFSASSRAGSPGERAQDRIRSNEAGSCSDEGMETEHGMAARRGMGLVVLDAFGGVGGNAIQFALCPDVSHVYACEIDGETAALGRHNSRVYGVHSKVDYVHCDCFHFMRSARARAARGANIVFLSPPWGGPRAVKMTKSQGNFTELESLGGLSVTTSAMVRAALEIAPVVALYLPKDTALSALDDVMREAGVEEYEVEKDYCGNHRNLRNFVAITVYISRLAKA